MAGQSITLTQALGYHEVCTDGQIAPPTQTEDAKEGQKAFQQQWSRRGGGNKRHLNASILIAISHLRTGAIGLFDS